MTLAAQSEYIHYHFENYKGEKPSAFSVEEAKQKIVSSFLDRFRAQQSSKAAKNASDDDIIALLKDFTSEGQIGKALVNRLNVLAFVPDEQGNYDVLSKISTGAGVGAGIKGLTIPDAATKMAEKVESYLDSMIQVLGHSQLDLLKVQLMAVKTGGTIPSSLKDVKIEGSFSLQELSLSDLEVSKAAANLQEKLSLLRSLSKDSSASSLSMESIAKSIAGSFSAIGGKMFEPVAEHAFNCGDVAFWEELVNANDNIKAHLPPGSFLIDGELRSKYTGSQKTLSGQDIKNDITMTYNKNGIEYTIGGSLKLNQQQKTLQGKSLRISNLHSGFTLSGLAEEAFRVSGQSINAMQWYEAGLGAIKLGKTTFTGTGEYKTVSSSWHQMLEYGRYAAALRMLTGAGKTVSLQGNSEIFDFSSIFVINNRIFSGYDVIKALVSDFKKYANMTGLGSRAFGDTRRQITNSFKTLKMSGQTLEDAKEERSDAAKEYITSFYKKKVTMSLNFIGITSALN